MGIAIIGLILAAIGVGAALTLRAIARAPLGYQDDEGFHFERERTERVGGARRARRGDLRPGGSLPAHDGPRHAA